MVSDPSSKMQKSQVMLSKALESCTAPPALSPFSRGSNVKSIVKRAVGRS